MALSEELRRDIQAWFDGELPENQAGRVASLIEQHPEAKAFVVELEGVRLALKHAHQHPRKRVVSSVPVFDAVARRARQPKLTLSGALYRLLSASVAMGLVILLVQTSFRGSDDAGHGGFRTSEWSHTVELVETDLENVTPVVYLDEPSGWTVIWVVPDEGTQHEERPAS